MTEVLTFGEAKQKFTLKLESGANFIRYSLNAGVVYEPFMDLASQQGSSGLRDETTQIIHYLPSLIRRWQKKKLIMNHGNKLELFFSLCPRSHCQLMFAELWVWSLWGRRTTSLQAVISCVLSLSLLISCPLLATEISVVFLFGTNANLTDDRYHLLTGSSRLWKTIANWW